MSSLELSIPYQSNLLSLVGKGIVIKIMEFDTLIGGGLKRTRRLKSLFEIDKKTIMGVIPKKIFSIFFTKNYFHLKVYIGLAFCFFYM